MKIENMIFPIGAIVAGLLCFFTLGEWWGPAAGVCIGWGIFQMQEALHER